MSEVIRNDAEGRYELEVDGLLAISAFRMDGEVITFTHTKVPEALEGRGIASRLVSGALADVRRRRQRVVPRCPFVHAYMDRHPEVQDLLA